MNVSSAVMIFPCMFLLLLVTGKGFSQCYNSSGCTGNLLPADDARDCCIGTDDGLSFRDGECTECIGKIL